MRAKQNSFCVRGDVAHSVSLSLPHPLQALDYLSLGCTLHVGGVLLLHFNRFHKYSCGNSKILKNLIAQNGNDAVFKNVSLGQSFLRLLFSHGALCLTDVNTFYTLEMSALYCRAAERLHRSNWHNVLFLYKSLRRKPPTPLLNAFHVTFDI